MHRCSSRGIRYDLHSETVTLGAIPRHAERLLALRMDGKDPAELVMISFDGLQPAFLDNYQMVADVARKYDWRLITGLDVCMLVRQSMPGLRGVMLDIARHIGPGRLYAWDIDENVGCELYALPDPASIDRPATMWRWNLNALPWLRIANERFLHGEPALHSNMQRHFFVRD